METTETAGRKPFRVLSHADIHRFDETSESTMHRSYAGWQRHQNIVYEIGSGKCVDAFIVDKEHPNGNEVHYILDNGVIVITNERTGKIVTELIARPRQIYRYWDGLGEDFPKEYRGIISKAREHQSNGYNEW